MKKLISEEEAVILSELGRKVTTVIYKEMYSEKDKQEGYITSETVKRIFDKNVLGYEVNI